MKEKMKELVYKINAIEFIYQWHEFSLIYIYARKCILVWYSIIKSIVGERIYEDI